MSIQVSTFNVKTKQRDHRYVFKDEEVVKITEAKVKLEHEMKYRAFDIVLVEYV